jgi:epoxyqueuosine reductase QueG
MQSSLLEQARTNANTAGLNLFGLVDRARFDAGEPRERRVAAIAPRCGTVLVLASGGRSLAQESARVASGHANVHALTARVLGATAVVAALLQSNGVTCAVQMFDGRCRVRAERLGEAAGFGAISPVSGLLLHPEFGPWLRVRAALFCDGMPFGTLTDASIAERFHPCCGCPKPCVAACPASVHDGLGQHDLGRCGSHRHSGGCIDECATRSACPIGRDHRDQEGEAAHRHTYELATLQRWFGLGAWRFVPKVLRGGP